MAYKANLGGYGFEERNIFDNIHPPIIMSYRFRPDEGAYRPGVLVARDDSGLLGLYERGAADWKGTMFGVLTLKIDTAKETVGNVLRHGVIKKNELLVGTAQEPINDTEIDALNELQIYPR